MKLNTIYAVRLAEIRESRGLTASSVACELGIYPGTYSKYETCTICPSMKILVQIADYFNVTVDYLIGRESANCVDMTEEQISRYIGFSADTVKSLHNSPVRDIQIQWRVTK